MFDEKHDITRVLVLVCQCQLTVEEKKLNIFYLKSLFRNTTLSVKSLLWEGIFYICGFLIEEVLRTKRRRRWRRKFNIQKIVRARQLIEFFKATNHVQKSWIFLNKISYPFFERRFFFLCLGTFWPVFHSTLRIFFWKFNRIENSTGRLCWAFRWFSIEWPWIEKTARVHARRRRVLRRMTHP